MHVRARVHVLVCTPSPTFLRAQEEAEGATDGAPLSANAAAAMDEEQAAATKLQAIKRGKCVPCHGHTCPKPCPPQSYLLFQCKVPFSTRLWWSMCTAAQLHVPGPRQRVWHMILRFVDRRVNSLVCSRVTIAHRDSRDGVRAQREERRAAASKLQAIKRGKCVPRHGHTTLTSLPPSSPCRRHSCFVCQCKPPLSARLSCARFLRTARVQPCLGPVNVYGT